MSTARAVLETLIEEGVSAKSHFQTWWALRNLALPTYYETMSDSAYVDFFHLSNGGHYKLFFLALSKIFDRDDRAAGLSFLRQKLRAEGHHKLSDNLEQALSPYTSAVKRVMSIRNQAIVHNEAAMSR